MALKDTWQNLQDAVAGVENSGSEISVEPINAIANAVIDIENKTESLEDVYVLQPNIDIIMSGTTVKGFVRCDFSQYENIKFPEGIIAINITVELPEPLVANNIYMPNSLKIINKLFEVYVDAETNEETPFNIKKCVLNEGLEKINRLFEGEGSIQYLNLPESLVILEERFSNLKNLEELKFPSNISVVPNVFVAFSTIKKIILGTHITSQAGNTAMFMDANVTIYGYAGSFAEELANKYNVPFVNMGSDYSTELGDIEIALDGIIAIQNNLMGVSE